MTRAEMIRDSNYQTILESMLPGQAVAQVIIDVGTFYKRKHNLSNSVLNSILILTILTTGQKLFNEAYLRKVAESFKIRKIKTEYEALAYIDQVREYKKKITKSERKEPEWVNDYVENLGLMEG